MGIKPTNSRSAQLNAHPGRDARVFLSSDRLERTQQIKRLAVEEFGFDLVGITSPKLPDRYGQAFDRWLSDGFQGSMAYMEREPGRRTDAARILPKARSVIALALNYYHSEDPRPSARSGKISKYAYGEDYHKIIERKLKRFTRFLNENDASARTYVDTGPVMERAYAEQAGLGFIGKNANLITRPFGSWVFLASVITDLELEFDRPSTASCGSCRLCLDACPTQAIVAEGKIDARRCISYLTIESREPIPGELAPKVSDWVFGCDVCQDVCPHNSRRQTTAEPGFLAARAGTWIAIDSVAAIHESPLHSDEAFQKRFQGSPVKRAKRAGLQRNIQVVSHNLAK